jgi:serine/threonine-protein kinase
VQKQRPHAVDAVRLRSRERLGHVLSGKWRLDELLGIGGMAAVYAATHRNGNRVAIKVLHAHCAVHESLCSRFQREGYVANLIDHPGAVRVLDDDRTDDGTVYLVMELLEGETLGARLIREGPMPAVEAATYVHDLLGVLASAHAKGIVHRDIKLDNLFITKSGELKVLDFGIARLSESADPGDGVRTDVGAMLGTPAYMAPEQALARSDQIDAQTDLWAAGATLFRLLTGRCVHEATTVNEQLVKAATEPAPPLLSILDTAPPDLACIVDRALAFQKAARWASAEDMQDALERLLSRRGDETHASSLELARTVAAIDGPPSNATRQLPPSPLLGGHEPAPATGASVVAEVAMRQGPAPRRSIQLALIGSFAIALLGSLAFWGSSRLRGAAAVRDAEPARIVSVSRQPLVPNAEPIASTAPATSAVPAPTRAPQKSRQEKTKTAPARLITDDDETFGRRH